ncbi:hypothetical protein G6F46_007924 [Rhizopus delemar]|uniref:Uncharacterized protein n=2 Tax=Rhizopus TaxID=4842 RepID=A0A9P6ZC04_9FUNG|nr:hypothetical protein G6F55_006759 [Rhizopus delemar]KAG1541000.1 hypothetical protein G6F51_008174 [Rhizopus arrhizus]KAG1495129.1 hypothetical protein G6F54_007389 [Rhizopus delemar]KAG1574258.1 hypothetical protein G6F50_002119 [Rhizopus delemar]KAG1582612.1 hypothetical protein G6F48_009041 [Rhizopus delemar]
MASSLSLPLVVWHGLSNPNITCITYSHSNIYTGQKDGHIWVYTFKDNFIQHKLLLVGHKKAVVALCVMQTESDCPSKVDILLSAAEDGEIIRWNALDGKCQAVNPNGFIGVPRALKVFSQISNHDIFCYGQANEITILNSTTLEVFRVWDGHSNWVTCMDFDEPDTSNPRLMTINMEGELNIWDYDSSKHDIHKAQSSRILDDTIRSPIFNLIKNKTSPRMFMVLTNKNVLIMAVNDGDFIPQFIIPSDPKTQWQNGDFFDKDHLTLWTMHGDIFYYKIQASAADNSKYSAVLIHSYHLSKSSPIYSESILTTVFQCNEKLYGFVTCNQLRSSAFTIFPLSLEGRSSEYTINTEYKSIWPIKNHQTDKALGCITVTESVNTNHLAIGYDTGKICVVPLSLALLHLNDISNHLDHHDDVRVFKKAHYSAVTCMLVPEHQVSGQQYLISGGLDGVVKIWNLIDGKYVASCAVHSTPVVSFIEPVEQKDTRIKGCIVSIAEDNSVALISVDSMSCLFIFPGHSHPLTTIQWRTVEDYLVLGYSDDTAFVWQMQTAHLDRVLHGKNTRDIMEDSRWPINRITIPKSSSSKNQSRQIVQVKSIVSNDSNLKTRNNFAQVFAVNVRRLAHSVHTRISNHQERESVIQPIMKASMSSSSSTTFDAVVPDALSFRLDKDDPLDNQDDKTKHNQDMLEKKIELIATVVSVITSWNINEAFEVLCSRSVKLTKEFSSNISYGLKGANGNLSILAPVKHEREIWTISSSLTAIRLLSISLLAKVVISMAGQENKYSDLITSYAMSLPLVIGKRYCFPSLSLLSKYWQDPSARSLFASAITGLPKDKVDSLINYWETFLPTSPSDNISPQMIVRASVILGIIGCDQPQKLSTRVCKSTASSLTLLLSDAEMDNSEEGGISSAGSVARILSSMELLSQGFKTWEMHIDAAEVLRTLFMYAADSRPTMAHISRAAKVAIFQISIANMPLVISTLTFDTIQAKSLDVRLRCLKIIGIFIKKEPILLYSYVQSVIETVVKTLDPNVPHMREAMVQSTTSILHDLVKTYPSVDFSSSAQKLAVGTLEGASVIYDIRTTTRSVVLEGHTGPVVALAFSPDAKLIATCSLLDQSQFN